MEDTLQTWGRPQSSSSRSGDMSGLLFVGGLPLHACDQNLTRSFRRFGPLASAAVQRRSSGRSKGSAFIQFVRPADAQNALTPCHTILGKKVSFRPANKPMEEVVSTEWNPRSTRRVYVTGIPQHFDQVELLRTFSRQVRIEKVSGFRKLGNSSLRCCYIVLQTLSEAEMLLSQKSFTTEKGEVLQICRQMTKVMITSQSQSDSSNRVGSTYVPNLQINRPESQRQLSHSQIKNRVPAAIVAGRNLEINGLITGKIPKASCEDTKIRIRKVLEIQKASTLGLLQRSHEYAFRFQLRRPNLPPIQKLHDTSVAQKSMLPAANKLED